MVDWRGMFQPPPEVEDFLGQETEANLREIEYFKNTVTPDVAERVGGLLNNYPNMNPKIGMYAGMMGVEPDSPLAFKLAQRNHDAFVEQNVKRFKEISRAKRASQLGLLMLDLGFQPVSRNFKSTVVAAQETGLNVPTAVSGNFSLGLATGLASWIPGVDGEKAADRIRKAIYGQEFADKYKEAKDAYGPAEFNLAYDEWKKGKPVNLGTGWFPESTKLQETQKYRDLRRQGFSEEGAYREAELEYGTPITEVFEEKENQFKANTRKAGKVDISPGRYVAGQFFTKDDLGYAVGSAALDGVFRIFADPVNLGLGYMSGAKIGLRSLVTANEQALFKTGKALAEESKNLPLLPRLYKTIAGGKQTLPNGEVIQISAKEARRLQYGRTTEQVLTTKRGQKFLQAMADAQGEIGLAVLMDIPQFKNLDPRILRLLSAIDNVDDMQKVLVSLMNQGNLSKLTPALRLRFGITDEVIQAIDEGGAAGMSLPMKANLIPEVSNAIAKKITGEYTDIAPIRKTVAKGRAALSEALPGDIFNVQDDVFNGVLNVFGELRNSLPYRMRKYFDLAPGKYVSIKNVGVASRNLDGIMKSGRLSLEQRGTRIKEMLDAESQDEIGEVVRNVYNDVIPEIQRKNPDLDIEDIQEVMTFLADESMGIKQYFVTEKGTPMAFPGTKMRKVTTKDGKDYYEATPTAQMISEMVDTYTPLIDYLELEKAFPLLRKLIGTKDGSIRKYIDADTVGPTNKMLKRLGLQKTAFKTNPRTGKPSIGGGGKAATLDMIYQDYLIQRVLKPIWMLRGALTTRVAPEEALRIMMSGSRIGLNHPFHYFAMKFSAGTQLELQNTAGDVLWSTRILKKEKEFLEEILGSEFVNAAKADYRAVEKIMKHTKIGVNTEGMASDDFVAWVLKEGGDGRDFIFDSYQKLNIKPLKVNKGTVRLGDELLDAVVNSSKGGTYNINKGTLETEMFASVSPYQRLSETIDADVIGNVAADSEPEAIWKLINSYLDTDTAAGAERLKYLRKENHALGWRMVDGNLQLDVSVSIPKLDESASVLDIEKAFVATAMLGIKGLQKSAFLPKETLRIMAVKNILESDKLRYWHDAIDEVLDPTTGDIAMGFMKFINPDSPRFAKNPNRLVDLDDVVNQRILNALYDTNFDVAKAVRRKKRGIMNAAPNGSWLPLTESYITAMATKAMKNFFQPEFRNQYKGIYKQHAKIVNGKLEEDYVRTFVHQMMLQFNNPISIKLANDGVDETLRYLLKNPEGKELLKRSIDMADVRGQKQKQELYDPINLRNNLEALNYRMTKLIGGEVKIKNPLNGEVVSEEWATKIRHTGTAKMYPLYEADLSTGSKMGQKLLKSGGFYNGKDYAEAWTIALANSGKGALAQSTRLKRFYKDFWDLVSPDMNMFPDSLPGSYSFLDDIADYSTGTKGLELALAKYDKMLEFKYNLFLTKPSDIMNRDPLYRYSLYEHGLEALGLFDEKTASEWIRGAEQQLRGSKFGEDVLAEYRTAFNKFKQIGFEEQITSIDQAMGILQKKAAATVMDLLYSTSQRHVFSDILSSYVPFPEIGAEVWKTWGGLFGKGPGKFNRARVAFDAAEEGKPYDASMGYFFRDPVSGKRMFSYPDPMGVIQKGWFGEDLRDEGIRVRPAGFLGALNLVTANGLLPSVGPKVTWTLEFFDRVIGSLPYAVKTLFLGDFRTNVTDIEEFGLQFIKPSHRKFFTQERFTENSTEYFDQQYASSVIDTLAVMYSKGLIDPTDPETADAEFEKFAEAANNQWLIRGLVQWTAPTGIQPRIELEDKDGNWWFVQTLAQEYDRMLIENNYDYMVTTDEFIDRFDINPIPLKLGKYKPGLRTPRTEGAVEYWLKPENREVMKQAPRTAYFTRPDTIDDRWVWSDIFNNAREYYDEKDWDLLARQTLIERELQKEKERLLKIADKSETDKYTTKWANANYALFRADLEKKSGIVAFGPLGIGEVASDPKMNILELYDWKNIEQLKNSPEYEPLSIYLRERDKAIDVLINGGKWRGGNFNKTAPTIYPLDSTSDRASWVREQLKQLGMELVEEYGDTYWNQLFYAILYSEVDNTRK